MIIFLILEFYSSSIHDSAFSIEQFLPEMSMAVLPLPPPLPRRHRRGGGGAVAVDFSTKRRVAVAVR